MNPISKVFIRVDASLEIGSGHVMRCLTLAMGLRECGSNVVFICREWPGHLCGEIVKGGFQVCRLPKPSEPGSPCEGDVAHARWLGVSWDQDAEETLQAIQRCTQEKPSSQNPSTVLIVDHYALEQRWEKALHPYVGRMMVIDDLADRPHDADILLDQNYHPEGSRRYAGLVPDSCTCLQGPSYALVRREFADSHVRARERNGSVKRVFVFFGGVDADNETSKVLQALQTLGCSGLSLDVVVGEGNPHKTRITQLCGALPDATIHCPAKSMAELMALADLAIGAGGTHTWERCAVGLPALGVALAENQVTVLECLAEGGAILYAGRSTSVSLEDWVALLNVVLSNPWLVKSLGCRSSALVDGSGVSRVVRRLSAPVIQLRRANKRDMEPLWHWRNEEINRRFSFQPHVIAWDEHRQWFENVLEDSRRVLLVAEAEDQAVGVLRYDLQEGCATTSVYLVPGFHGKGLGALILRQGAQWIKEQFPHIQRLKAEIRAENAVSQKTFLAAGFQESVRQYELIFSVS